MKQSDLLRKQADMMDMAEKYGIDHWMKLVKLPAGTILYDLRASDNFINAPLDHSSYIFALAVVEGKPVFEGDELYNRNGVHFIVDHIEFTGAVVSVSVFGQAGDYPSECSWNPPKPKNVMVELTVEDATRFVVGNDGLTTRDRLTAACRKALEAL